MLGKTSSASNERLIARRRKRRRRLFTVFSILSLLVAMGIIYELRQNPFRIRDVEIFGADQSYAAIAYQAMEGYYFGIIPRDSIFFFPATHIRANIIELHPDVAAISFFRKGLNGLSIKINDRIAIARWCGLAPTERVEEYCYVFDASGLIFAPHSSSTATLNKAALYAPLEGEMLEPLGATIAHAKNLSGTFDFARQLGTFGSPVAYILIEGDEVHHRLESGTRVTYVLGREQNAYTALVSSKENFNFTDGSVEYVDLRFDGKVYLKRKE
jgi:hypothetical protein